MTKIVVDKVCFSYQKSGVFKSFGLPLENATVNRKNKTAELNHLSQRVTPQNVSHF